MTAAPGNSNTSVITRQCHEEYCTVDLKKASQLSSMSYSGFPFVLLARPLWNTQQGVIKLLYLAVEIGKNVNQPFCSSHGVWPVTGSVSGGTFRARGDP